MPATLSEAPAAALEVVRNAVFQLCDGPGFPLPRLAEAKLGELEFRFPHRVAALAANSLQDRPVALPVRWRFILYDKGQPIAAVRASHRREAYQFAQLDEAPIVASTVTALELSLAHAFRGEGEPLLLLAPGLRTAALWLKAHPDPGPERGQPPPPSPISRDDLFLALPPVIPAFPAYDPIDAETFVRELARIAATLPQDGARGG